MLRTMELIVGVGPLSQFDAAATPMLNSFSQRPRLDPYTARRPTVSFSELNGADAPWRPSRPTRTSSSSTGSTLSCVTARCQHRVTNLRTREEADEEAG